MGRVIALCVFGLLLYGRVFAGPIIPHVPRGSINLRPEFCIAAHNVTFWDNRVYMGGAANSGAGPTVWAIEAGDPDVLRCIGGAGRGYKAYGIKVFEDKLYAANWATVLRIYDISSGAPVVLGEYSTPGEFGWNLDVARDRVYLGEGSETQSKFYIFDVSDPTNPQPLPHIEISRAGGVTVRGSYAYYTNDRRFEIANVSDELNPYVVYSRDMGHMILGGVRLRGDYAYVHWSQVTDGGLYVFDVSDPTAPELVGSYEGPGATDMCLLGNYAFYTTSGNGFMTLDISDPTNPHSVAQTNLYGYELCVTGNGQHVFVGNLAGDNEGWLHAVKVLDSDPDDEGPSKWSNFSLSDASWDTSYEADSIPTASNPRWKVAEGSQSWASASGGLLHIVDSGTSPGDKIKWVRNWNATNTRGTTILARARCVSYDLAGGPIDYVNNIFVEDGKYREEFAILSDRIRAVNARMEYALDGTQWHTYRITTQRNEFRVYVDESATPVMVGTLSATTQRSRVMFGSGASASKQDIYFDYIRFCSDGVFPPGGLTGDTTPDISVSVADVAGKDSLSGINPLTAKVHWSTDGGQTWSSSGGMPWQIRYEGASLPSGSSPSWTVAEGSESLASTADGILRVNDSSTASGSKIKWAQNWGASASTGAAVVVRARCASAGGDLSLLGNIYIDDGTYSQRFQILPDKVVASEAGLHFPLDGMRWHTYRITTKNGVFKVYVDEAATPVLMGGMAASDSSNKIMFGSGASAATQDIYFDYVRYTTDGDIGPGKCAGIVTCTGYDGDDRGVISAFGIPFNQHSQTLNQVRFSIEDMAGNTGWSPIYNVRTTSAMVTNVSSLDPDRIYKLGERIYINIAFSQPVYVTGSPRLRLNSSSTTLATYHSGSGTDSIRFRYFVGSGDESPDLDCAGPDALMLNGGSINDAGGNPVTLNLPAPGTAGSLSFNKNLVVDAKAPSVSISGPTAHSDYPANSSPLQISGTAVDGCGIAQVAWTNSAGGSGTCSGTAAWQSDIPLAEGANTITIKAQDTAGNSSTDTLNVFYVPGSPVSIPAAKALENGTNTYMSSKLISAIFGDCFYVQEADRSAGIRVVPQTMPSWFEVGQLIDVAGSVQTGATGERFVDGAVTAESGP